MPYYLKLRKSQGENPQDRNQVPDEQQSGVDTFLLMGEDEDSVTVNPDMTANIAEDRDGVRLVAIEKAVSQLAFEFYKSRESNKSGPINYPRVEVLVDTNCLITYTGPIEKFDRDYFRQLLDQTINGRLALEDRKNEEPEPKVPAEIPYHG